MVRKSFVSNVILDQLNILGKPRVGHLLRFYLIAAVTNGGVVPFKESADFVQGIVGQQTAQIHGDLPCVGYIGPAVVAHYET